MPFALLSGCFRGRKAKKPNSGNTKKKGLRSMTPAQEIKLKKLEKVLKELECPICFNTCIPPIFTCINGHIICTRCRRNVKVCPTCREGFSTTRNLFAENFIEQYSQGCRFAKEGCKFLRWKGDDMKTHEVHCAYRMIQCIVPSCQQMVNYQSLLPHLAETHKIGGTSELPVIIQYVTQEESPMRDRKWLPYYIQAFGCTFYVMLEIKRPHFWSWVWVHCPKAGLVEKFNFVACLKLQSTKKISLEWRGPVYPIRVPGSMIINEGLCFGGSEALIQHFEIESSLPLYVDIEKIPGGFSDGNMSDGAGSTSFLASENEASATGDMERERNFSQLVLTTAASHQVVLRRSTVDIRHAANGNASSSSGKSRRSTRHPQ